jgi:hypothetical protein
MPVHWCCHQLLYSGHYNSCFWERRRKISPGPFAGIDIGWIKIALHRYLMSNARSKALLYPIGKYFGPKGLIGDGSKSSVLERQTGICPQGSGPAALFGRPKTAMVLKCRAQNERS